MKSKTIILLGIAVVCGLVASFMTQRLLADRGKDQPVEEEEKLKILVAKQSIPQGTLIDDPNKYFKDKMLAKDDVPKGAIDSPDKLKNRRVNRPLVEDSHVTEGDLMDMKMADLVYKLHPGMRAIAVRVTAESSASGFILQNTHVDVIWTTGSSEGKVARTILQNMLVLAVDTSDERNPTAHAQVGQNILLEATPEQANKLRAAQASGELSLVLRQAEDKVVIKNSVVSSSDIANNRKNGDDEEDNSDTPLPGAGPGQSVGGRGALPNGTAKRPTAPEPPKEPEKQPEKQPDPPPKEKEPDVWVVRIKNGQQTTLEKYLLDENGKVIDSENDKKKPAVNDDPAQDAKPDAKDEAPPSEAPKPQAPQPAPGSPQLHKPAMPPTR